MDMLEKRLKTAVIFYCFIVHVSVPCVYVCVNLCVVCTVGVCAYVCARGCSRHQNRCRGGKCAHVCLRIQAKHCGDLLFLSLPLCLSRSLSLSVARVCVFVRTGVCVCWCVFESAMFSCLRRMCQCVSSACVNDSLLVRRHGVGSAAQVKLTHFFQGASQTILGATLVDLQEIYETTTQKISTILTWRSGYGRVRGLGGAISVLTGTRL